jgi:hypothetical protein
MTGSSSFEMCPASGSLAGTVDLVHDAVGGRHPVQHARRGRYQVHVVLALEPFLHDFHVQQAEEAAAESKPERDRRLGLVEERGVVQTQLLERFAQLRVLVALDGIESREDHRLELLETRETAPRSGARSR